MARSLIWFRGSDLRISDQAALLAAAAADEMAAVFFLPEDGERPGHDRFLRESVAELAASIAGLGGRLDLIAGDPSERLPVMARELSVDAVHTLSGTLPAEAQLDAALTDRLGDLLHLHPGHTLAPPGSVRSGSGSPYAVFTPFAKRFRETVSVEPSLALPKRLPPPPPDWAPDPIAFDPRDDVGGITGGGAAARPDAEWPRG